MSPDAPPISFIEGYLPPAGGFDELLDPGHQPRSHWLPFLESLSRFTPADLAQRAETARRLLQEHGATYNLHAEGEDHVRPWKMDLLPLIIPAREWQHLEAGVIQRTRLLDALLADLYGPQRTLKEGLLPPAIHYANPAFLRSIHGFRPTRGVFLFHHAVDLARSPDGQWWVLADRTQAPSGTGYALENRLVLSRLFPNEFYVSQIRQIAPFFETLRGALARQAPTSRSEPRAVLLTPGPRNETYFEHSFLARHLGCALVEGEDLTVRDERVYVKTLDGLQPVDVILRRVDEHYCDPLELDAGSHLGVTGLLQAIRARHVTVLNAPGSGAVEVAALLAFIPALCRHFLGEDLRLPSLATWWCGQEKERGYVLDHLDSLVIKPAFPGSGRQPRFGPTLDGATRQRLMDAIAFAPTSLVGQERVTLSTTPVWVENRFEPRPLVLRVFVINTGDGFAVLPGGLTRVAPEQEATVVSSQSGGGSKDTWVLAGASQPASQPSGLPPRRRVGRTTAPADVPSRVADNLFWFGRYAERLEDTARILRCGLVRLADEASLEPTPELLGLVQLLMRLELLPAPDSRAAGDESVRRAPDASVSEAAPASRIASSLPAGWQPGLLERQLLRLVFESHQLGAIQELRYRLSQTAFVVRDRFSLDILRLLDRLETDTGVRPGRQPLSLAISLLNTLILHLAALSGMEMENMVRGHGWRFLDIGRRLERALNLITLIQAGMTLEEQNLGVLPPLLEIADSTLTYRRLHFAQPAPGPVLELLLLEDRNPRSLIFQLRRLATHAADLPGARSRAAGHEPVERIRHAVAAARQIKAGDLWKAGRSAERPNLLARLESVAVELRALSTALSRRYFSHLPPSSPASP